MSTPSRPRLLLAPMEGLLDHALRDLLTRVGGVDHGVSEFLRITGTLLPPKFFRRVVPELQNGWRTRAGVKVHPQLLGSDAACMADNAARLAGLGTEPPPAIDLNFGCPAKTVNRHRGGAVLLDEPELLGEIAGQVRRAVPPHVPITAKMRLGNECDSRSLECALALVGAGVSGLVIHARTKVQGYKPPAYWHKIAQLKEGLPSGFPVVANGEIWTVDDARRARAESGCADLMLGRGLVTRPGLALAIRRADELGLDDAGLAQAEGPEWSWADMQPLLQAFWWKSERHVAARHRSGRLKQWLFYLRNHYAEAAEWHARVRTIADHQALAHALWGGLPPDLDAGTAQPGEPILLGAQGLEDELAFE